MGDSARIPPSGAAQRTASAGAQPQLTTNEMAVRKQLAGIYGISPNTLIPNNNTRAVKDSIRNLLGNADIGIFVAVCNADSPERSENGEPIVKKGTIIAAFYDKKGETTFVELDANDRKAFLSYLRENFGTKYNVQAMTESTIGDDMQVVEIGLSQLILHPKKA
jgi:hypothetical protein